MKGLASAMVLSAWSILAGCSRIELPYDVSKVKTAERPAHALRIALLPFTDARSSEDGEDGAERFEYRGIEFQHTRLDRLGDPLQRITELVARHLAASRTFSQVIMVLSPDQAPEADLLLGGRVRRMRGYVEAEAPSAKSGRPKQERLVLAEVVLADIEVRDAKHPDRLLFSMDAGWSMYEPRLAPEHAPDPWAILSEALFHAVSDMTEELAAADLSGALIVRDKVGLAVIAGAAVEAEKFGSIGAHPPVGWRSIGTSTAARPIGWRSAEPRCWELKLEQQQTKKFHRVLGAYRPAVILWSCPKDLALSYDARVEFPARYLGERADGSRYFVHTLGESNWPSAADEVKKYLAITPPAKRHVFELRSVVEDQ